MQGQLERALPFVAAWGVWVVVVLLALVGLGIWRLGRARNFLVPATWAGRFCSLGLLGLAALLAVALCGLLGPMRPMLAQVRSLEGWVGHPAPDLAFRRVADDTPLRLSDFRGKVVVLNLWATWCPPCRRELPGIDRLQRTYRARGLVVVTLSNEERERLLRFSAGHPLTTLNVYASRLDWLDVPGRPLSLILSRDGVVRECMIGGRGYSEFETRIGKYLRPA